MSSAMISSKLRSILECMAEDAIKGRNNMCKRESAVKKFNYDQCLNEKRLKEVRGVKDYNDSQAHPQSTPMDLGTVT